MLECARTFRNYRAIVALGQNILRHYYWREEKQEINQANRDIVRCNKRLALDGDAIITS